ncbi:hypothetical protein QFC22_005889 [Naganishia vaughanmartiniae]|uniref:Uncharacterized protein n=1 Tax=Naganishia vaughanmartiniae TaxID=1424756 RepID=A0ACC2WQL6_9TREE|nr:hypothetical protein QFC22_005889 [Naganishia vaughanmartiniae]
MSASLSSLDMHPTRRATRTQTRNLQTLFSLESAGNAVDSRQHGTVTTTDSATGHLNGLRTLRGNWELCSEEQSGLLEDLRITCCHSASTASATSAVGTVPQTLPMYEVTEFMSSGLAGRCPSLIRLAITALSFDNSRNPGSNNSNDIPIFNTDLLHRVPLGVDLRESLFRREILPMYETAMRKAIKFGAAVILVKTNVGGYTGDPQQLDHIVPYILLGLDRLCGNDAHGLQPHLVLMDGARAVQYRYSWDMPAHHREKLHSGFVSYPRDDNVADRIIAIAQLMAKIFNGEAADPPLKFHEWSLPAVPQQADRGCVLHSIANACIATSCRDDLLLELDAVIQQIREQPNVAQSHLNKLYDVSIPTLWNVYMWGPRCNLPAWGGFCSNDLFEQHAEKAQAGSALGRPSFFDLALYQIIVSILHVAIFGNPKDLLKSHKDMGEKMVYLDELTKITSRPHDNQGSSNHRDPIELAFTIKQERETQDSNARQLRLNVESTETLDQPRLLLDICNVTARSEAMTGIQDSNNRLVQGRKRTTKWYDKWMQ